MTTPLAAARALLEAGFAIIPVPDGDCFGSVVRIALSAEQVRTFNLPPQMGKETDSRAGAFVARHGALVQVELDALPPDQLRVLYQEAINCYWDTSLYDAVIARERDERQELVGGAP